MKIIGKIFTFIMKAILTMVLGIIRFTLEVMKLFLLLLSMVLRVFGAFVRAGTP